MPALTWDVWAEIAVEAATAESRMAIWEKERIIEECLGLSIATHK
jgi:hypothetical protein